MHFPKPTRFWIQKRVGSVSQIQFLGLHAFSLLDSKGGQPKLEGMEMRSLSARICHYFKPGLGENPQELNLEFCTGSGSESAQGCMPSSPRSGGCSARSAPSYNHFTEMCSGSEAGLHLRLIDSCITQLKAQGPSRTCNESKEEEEAKR